MYRLSHIIVIIDLFLYLLCEFVFLAAKSDAELSLH